MDGFNRMDRCRRIASPSPRHCRSGHHSVILSEDAAGPASESKDLAFGGMCIWCAVFPAVTRFTSYECFGTADSVILSENGSYRPTPSEGPMNLLWSFSRTSA